MRLIDADKLIDNLDAMIPDYDYSDKSLGIATAIQEAGRMAFYEEVKAIPIDWIKDKMDKLEDIGRLEFCEYLDELLVDWEKEND